MTKIPPGHVLKHACGLNLRNVKKSDIVLPGDVCPQCRGAIASGDIGHSTPAFVTWTLHPPHGMAFKNSLGSEVTISIPQGQEDVLFHELTRQLNVLFQNHMRMRQPQNADNAAIVERAKRALSSRVVINEDGELTIEDGPPTSGPAGPTEE